MIKCNNFIKSIFLCTLVLTLAHSIFAQDQYLDAFPGECSYASDREPLDGHIIRLGFVRNSSYGWSFFFPDRKTSKDLERVDIADNAGIIGQDPDDDLSDDVFSRTPDGSYVVAQIFIADDSVDPIVTCVSESASLTRYNPSYYGRSFVWLDRTTFGHWLRWKKYYKRWNWRKWWRKDFYSIKEKFRGFKNQERRRHKKGYKKEERRKFRKFDKEQRKPLIGKPKKGEVGIQKEPTLGRTKEKRLGRTERQTEPRKGQMRKRNKGGTTVRHGGIKKEGGMTRENDLKRPAFNKTSMPQSEVKVLRNSR